MITAHIKKMNEGGWSCDNPSCQHLPEFTYHMLGDIFFIKKDSIYLTIVLNGEVAYYCNGCIDIIYNQLKPVLDRKLWIFD